MSVFDRGKVTTVAVTIAIAIGAGHVMQYGIGFGGSAAQEPAPRPSAPRPQRGEASTLPAFSPLLLPLPSARDGANGLPATPEALLTPIGFPSGTLAVLRVPEDRSELPASAGPARTRGLGTICKVEASAEAAAGATIRLSLDACERDIPVLIDHDGLTFTANTGPDGRLGVEIPAFQSAATVTVSVAGQPPIALDVAVPDADWYDRLALLWDGGATLSIHALEIEPDLGSAAHASEPLPQTKGGVVTRLGDASLSDPALAEVYSFVSGGSHGSDTLEFSASTEVTEATCGQRLAVRVLQSVSGAAPRESNLLVTYPGCDAVGDILVLKNLLQDLKIARN